MAIASSVTHYDITWTFNTNYTVGQYANGDWYVVNPGSGVTIIGITPECVNNAGRIMHGSMITPHAIAEHGFDSWQSACYNASLNVGYGISSETPLVLSSGDFLLSGKSYDDPAAHGNRCMESYEVLTCVSAEPAAGDFRPPFVYGASDLGYNISDVSTALLANLTPSADAPSWAVVEGLVRAPRLGEFIPTWQRVGGGPNDNYDGYGREFCAVTGLATLMLNSNYTAGQKATTLTAMVQMGLDIYACFLAALEEGASNPYPPDGGNNCGRKWPIMFAGAVLGNANMRDIALTYENFFHEDAQTFYVTQDDVDRTNSGSWNPDTRSATAPYTAEMIGMPEWGIRHSDDPYEDNADWTAMYRQCCNEVAMHGVVLSCLAMGLEVNWNHVEFFNYMDRYYFISTGQAGTYTFGGTEYTVPNQAAGWGDWLYTYPVSMWADHRSTYGVVDYENVVPPPPAGAGFHGQDVDIVETFEAETLTSLSEVDASSVLNIHDATDPGEGTYGMSLSWVGQTGYIQHTMEAPSNVMSGGFWLKGPTLAAWDFGPRILQLQKAGVGAVAYISYERQADHRIYIKGNGDDVFVATPGTWYWITWKYTRNTAFEVTIYNAAEEVVDTLSATALDQPVDTVVQVGGVQGVPNKTKMMYMDSVVIDLDGGVYPIVAWGGEEPPVTGIQRRRLKARTRAIIGRHF